MKRKRIFWTLFFAVLMFISAGIVFAGNGLIEMNALPSTVAITTENALGAGCIATADGYIVTNRHVIQGASEIYVWLSDFTKYKARVVGFHSEADIAVIKIEPTEPLVPFKPASFANPNQIFIGDTVYTIGHPFGFVWSVTKGIISQKLRDKKGVRYWQIDASINPGNSGGPLLDENGRLIGINAMAIPPSYAENIAIAISIQSFIEEVTMLIEADMERLAPIENVHIYNEENTTPAITDSTKIDVHITVNSDGDVKVESE